jgi:hypothetical protein
MRRHSRGDVSLSGSQVPACSGGNRASERLAATFSRLMSGKASEGALMRRSVVVLLSVVIIAGCGGTEQPSPTTTAPPSPAPAAAPEPEPEPADEPDGLVREADFDGTWPFGVPEVLLECRRGEVLVAIIGDDIYALNGPAITAGFIELTLETPNEIWLDNPATGAKVSVSDVSQRARTLC